MGAAAALLVWAVVLVALAACWKRCGCGRYHSHHCRRHWRQLPLQPPLLDPLVPLFHSWRLAWPIACRLLGLAVSRFAKGKAFRLTVGQFFFAGLADVRLRLHVVRLLPPQPDGGGC